MILSLAVPNIFFKKAILIFMLIAVREIKKNKRDINYINNILVFYEKN